MSVENPTPDQRIEIGSRVKWISQAGGYRKLKMGHVVAIVPAGFRPDRERFPSLYKGSGCGFPRDHDSFVVKANGRLYWPRAKALDLVL